jgi:hypothetical protein
MRFARWVFRIAAVSGLLVLIPMYFREGSYGAKYPPAITHPEFYYGFVGVAVAWQLAFWIISTDPVRFRPLMLAAIVEKATWGAATISLYMAGRLNSEMLAAGVLDLAFGVLFVVSYVRTVDASRRWSAARVLDEEPSR